MGQLDASLALLPRNEIIIFEYYHVKGESMKETIFMLHQRYMTEANPRRAGPRRIKCASITISKIHGERKTQANSVWGRSKRGYR